MFVILTNTLYRLRIVGQQHVPQSGGALLVPNHMSFVDGFLLMASVDRPIRFVVDAAYATHPLFKWLMTAMKVIPITSAGDTRMILRALRSAGQALDDGEIVCIFPEGQITRTGTLLPFRRGFERIVKGRQVPVIPVHLDRLWGSIFSFERGRFLRKWPERIPYPLRCLSAHRCHRIRRRTSSAMRSAHSEKRPGACANPIAARCTVNSSMP